jgi:transposase
MQSKVNKINFNGIDLYIGLDVHSKNWRVTLNMGGQNLKTFSQDPEAVKLSSYLKKNYPGANYLSAYEAGYCGFSVHRELESYGIKNLIANPADVPTTDKDRKQKEDKRDSRKIAKALSNGELEAIYVPPIELEELRSLVRYRKTLVKEIGRNKNRVKSILHLNGVKIPGELAEGSRSWSGRFTSWLKGVNLKTEYGDTVLSETIETTMHIRGQLLKVTRYLRKVCKEGPFAKQASLLRSIPGIGLIMALTLITELGDIKRFKSLDRLCSYIGLVPTTKSSGDKDRSGKITPRSNRHIRGNLIESAWVAARHDPALSLCYSRLSKRMESNEAIIRVAKKLVNRIRYVLINEKEYVKSVI